VERGAEAIDRRGGFCTRRIGLRGCPAPGCTAKLNDVDPLAWLADVLARIADHKITDLAALLAWNWRHAIPVARAARHGGAGFRSYYHQPCR
jgi:hypothetical protein